MPGPKKTPTKILALRGSWIANTRKDEPSLPTGIPECPEWVTGKARKFWSQISPLIDSLRVSTQVDGVAIGLLVNALALYLDAKKIVDVCGIISITDKCTEFQNPAVGVMNNAWDRVMKACREFGLTPSARAGLKTYASNEEKDPLAEFVAKKKSV